MEKGESWNMKSIAVGILIGVVGIAAALYITGVSSDSNYQVKSNMGFKLDRTADAPVNYLESYALQTCMSGKNCALTEETKYCVRQACFGTYYPEVCARKVSYSCGGPYIPQ